ncbi:MAG TPA: RNA 2',3'-cyclic phosphodiesterase [Solirubrobacterales bacterium]|nr:RNA 2',3'-cyclic phosphodiesterase [Solirubrobacterales bacterium]
MFVALDLPQPVREGVAAWGREELADPALRPVPPENLHITLAFLGYRPAGDVKRIAAGLAECAAPAPLVELGDPVAKPHLRSARLFALPALSPGAEQIEAELVELLEAKRLYKPEKRPFWPHVTLARVRPASRGSRRPAAVEKVPGALSASLSKPFYGVRLTLYRSVLQPQGALYSPLAQVELPGAGRQ